MPKKDKKDKTGTKKITRIAPPVLNSDVWGNIYQFFAPSEYKSLLALRQVSKFFHQSIDLGNIQAMGKKFTNIANASFSTPNAVFSMNGIAQNDRIKSLAVSHDGKCIALVSALGTILYRDENTHIHTLTKIALKIEDCAFITNNCLASMSQQQIHIWDLESKDIKCTLIDVEQVEPIIGFLPLSSTCIVSWSKDNKVRIWDAESETCRTLNHDFNLNTVKKLSSDKIICSDSDKKIIVWDLTTDSKKIMETAATKELMAVKSILAVMPNNNVIIQLINREIGTLNVNSCVYRKLCLFDDYITSMDILDTGHVIILIDEIMGKKKMQIGEFDQQKKTFNHLLKNARDNIQAYAIANGPNANIFTVNRLGAICQYTLNQENVHEEAQVTKKKNGPCTIS